MVVLVQIGGRFENSVSAYQEMIKKLVGNYVDVMDLSFHHGRFIINGGEFHRREISYLDIEYIVDDTRIGKFKCCGCGRVLSKSSTCECGDKKMIKILGSSIMTSRSGMEELLDFEFSDLLPNVKQERDYG